jgi:hypothetical protein
MTAIDPHTIDDIHYADALWQTALQHRHNPVVAQRLAQLEAAIKLVEEQSLADIADRKREESDSMWWSPTAGFKRGIVNTVVGSPGTGKSMWGSKYLEQFYKEC